MQALPPALRLDPSLTENEEALGFRAACTVARGARHSLTLRNLTRAPVLGRYGLCLCSCDEEMSKLNKVNIRYIYCINNAKNVTYQGEIEIHR